MATSETHDHDHDHGHDGGAHHVDPLWLYLTIFGALLVMTVVTVGASYIDFGGASVAVAVLIATVKAFLVAFFFMHLRHDKPFHSLVLVSGLLFLSFLFLFTLSDGGTRNDVDDMHGKPVLKAAPAASKLPLVGPLSKHPAKPSRGVAFLAELSILPLPSRRIMANYALWNVRKRHEWLAKSKKQEKMSRRGRLRIGLQAAMDRKNPQPEAPKE